MEIIINLIWEERYLKSIVSGMCEWMMAMIMVELEFVFAHFASGLWYWEMFVYEFDESNIDSRGCKSMVMCVLWRDVRLNSNVF